MEKKKEAAGPTRYSKSARKRTNKREREVEREREDVGHGHAQREKGPKHRRVGAPLPCSLCSHKGASLKEADGHSSTCVFLQHPTTCARGRPLSRPMRLLGTLHRDRSARWKKKRACQRSKEADERGEGIRYPTTVREKRRKTVGKRCTIKANVRAKSGTAVQHGRTRAYGPIRQQSSHAMAEASRAHFVRHRETMQSLTIWVHVL